MAWEAASFSLGTDLMYALRMYFCNRFPCAGLMFASIGIVLLLTFRLEYCSMFGSDCYKRCNCFSAAPTFEWASVDSGNLWFSVGIECD